MLPVATLILVGLFAVQSHGTAGLARYFAPFMTLWFIVIGMAGAVHILQEPRVLAAINPAHAASFMASHAMLGLVVLGAVFLAVTGVEALYADLGHFGRKPIQIAWLFLVFPALVLNYSGQAALLLVHPDAVDNPFYRLVPEALLMPMVLLATTATVIASQAVITGTYSLTRQAVQLGLLPKLEVRHTSEEESGQIYMPRVKGLMLIGVLLLVLMFQSSSKLASAYGIAVTGTMVVTSILAFFVIWKAWKWSMTAAAVLMAPLAAIDLIFLGSNLLKVTQGGWVALAVAGFVLLMMWTWRRGTKIITTTIRKQDVPLKKLVKDLEASPPTIVPGAAIYFVRRPHFAPAALLHSLKHFKVLHERVAVMTIHTVNAPRVAIEKAVEVERLSQHFWQIDLSCGFMQVPDLPKALASAHATGCKFDMMETSFIVSRVSIKPDGSSGMPLWQDHLFITLSRNEVDAPEYFGIPHNRVVEVGLQLIV